MRIRSPRRLIARLRLTVVILVDCSAMLRACHRPCEVSKHLLACCFVRFKQVLTVAFHSRSNFSRVCGGIQSLTRPFTSAGSKVDIASRTKPGNSKLVVYEEGMDLTPDCLDQRISSTNLFEDFAFDVKQLAYICRTSGMYSRSKLFNFYLM